MGDVLGGISKSRISILSKYTAERTVFLVTQHTDFSLGGITRESKTLSLVVLCTP